MLCEGANHKRRWRFMTSHAMLSHCVLPVSPGRQIINNHWQYFDNWALRVLTPYPRCVAAATCQQLQSFVSVLLDAFSHSTGVWSAVAELTPQYTITVVAWTWVHIFWLFLLCWRTLDTASLHTDIQNSFFLNYFISVCTHYERI